MMGWSADRAVDGLEHDVGRAGDDGAAAVEHLELRVEDEVLGARRPVVALGALLVERRHRVGVLGQHRAARRQPAAGEEGADPVPVAGIGEVAVAPEQVPDLVAGGEHPRNLPWPG